MWHLKSIILKREISSPSLSEIDSPGLTTCKSKTGGESQAQGLSCLTHLIHLLFGGVEGQIPYVECCGLGQPLLKLLLVPWKSPVSIVGKGWVQELQTTRVKLVALLLS